MPPPPRDPSVPPPRDPSVPPPRDGTVPPRGPHGAYSPDPSFPPPLIRFVEMFNRGEFWESHEVLEGPWREGGSAFYQGLILYASAFVHAQRTNRHGVEAQMGKALRALEPFGPFYLGVDVVVILTTAAALRNDPSGGGWQQAAHLHLDPDLVRGDEPELELPGA